MTTPLHEAIAMNDLEEVEYLLHTPGTEVDAVGEQGTPLCYAACTNHIEAAELLIAAGADVNWTSTLWPGPLQLAALRCNIEMAILLLDSGADVELSSSLLSPLYCACSRPCRDLIFIFIESGADVNKWIGRGPLQVAAVHNDADIIQLLLDAGAHVDSKGSNGAYGDRTPLHVAVGMGNRKSVRALLAAKADPNLERDLDNCTALDVVISNRDAVPSIIEDLVSHGANVLHKNKLTGRTALQELAKLNATTPGLHISHTRLTYCQIASIFVAAGDRNWDCVPVPCPGIERALLPVWRAAPEELAEVVKRLEEDLKETLYLCLHVMQGRLPMDLRMRVLGAVLEK